MKTRGQVSTHKSTLVEEYIRQLSDLGISLKSLQILGDFEFSKEDSKLTEKELLKKVLEDKNYKKQKETIEKYIKEFIKADLVTQEPHKRRGETLFGSATKDVTGTPLSDDWVDGGVFFYRTPEKDKDGKPVQVSEGEYIKEVNSDKYVQLQYVTPEKFQKMVNNKDKNLRYKYTLDESTGELKIAQIKIIQNNYIVEGSLESSNTTVEIEEILIIDYKSYIEKYTMPYEFLITLTEITQNPEFVYHVAKLARETNIILVVQDDTVIQDVNVKSKEKVMLSGYEIEANVERQTITTTMKPHLEMQYANTWSFYEEFEYTKDVIINGPSTSGNTTTKITTTKYNPPILKDSVEKSKQFLGLLRNSNGTCEYSNCYKDGKIAQKCAKDAVFNRGGINVEYLIPNSTRTEDPLAKLWSGEELLYDLLGANLEGNASQNASDDPNSSYKTKMSGIVEHMKYLMKFPDNEDIDVKYELDEEDQIDIDPGEVDYEEDLKDVTDDELEILYKICEAEAGGSKTGEEIGHVACVILNRVKCSKWPNNIKDVVFQPNQFSPIKNGAYQKAVPSEKTKKAVDSVIAGGDTTGGAVYFRTEASAKKAGMPISKDQKHKTYIYLFTDPNTHVFHTDTKSLEELRGSTGGTSPATGKLEDLFPDGIPITREGINKYIVTVQVPITKKDGTKTTTGITVHKGIVQDLTNVLKKAQDGGFKVYDIQGFSWRTVSGTSKMSQHSLGLAVDINVKENYCVYPNGKVDAGSYWKPGTDEYSIPKDGVLVKAFKSIGWGWGGEWKSKKDYMHFSFTGN